VTDFLERFETKFPFDNFDNAEWIPQQWVEMFLKKCPSKFGSRGKREGEATSDQ
jgi:hypothetical protein